MLSCSPPVLNDTPKLPLPVSTKYLAHHALPSAFLENYSLGDELGSGGFGFVLAATHRASGMPVAVKFILRDKVPAHAWVRLQSGQVMPMEVYVLKTTQHPSIIQYVDDYQDDRFHLLVMELHGTQWTAQAEPLSPPHSPALSHTLSEDSWDDEIQDPPTRRPSCDLFECIERYHHFQEPLAKMIFSQIVDCVAYLDQRGICHRDIKDENFVIDDQFKVKMIDFGSSVLLPRHYGHNNKTYLFEKFYGTISFASPEILLGQRYRAEPAEIWSLGVLLYTLLFGEVPFSGPQQAIAGQCAPPKHKVSPKCLHLLSCLLDPHPDRRPTIQQVLMHPWFAA